MNLRAVVVADGANRHIKFLVPVQRKPRGVNR